MLTVLNHLLCVQVLHETRENPKIMKNSISTLSDCKKMWDSLKCGVEHFENQSCEMDFVSSSKDHTIRMHFANARVTHIGSPLRMCLQAV